MARKKAALVIERFAHDRLIEVGAGPGAPVEEVGAGEAFQLAAKPGLDRDQHSALRARQDGLRQKVGDGALQDRLLRHAGELVVGWMAKLMSTMRRSKRGEWAISPAAEERLFTLVRMWSAPLMRTLIHIRRLR